MAYKGLRAFALFPEGSNAGIPWEPDRRTGASCTNCQVEDNDLNAEIATEILKMTGLTVERAEDGIEAVDRMASCEDGYFDMIFMDIQMPRMNGYDAARAIRAMSRHYCKQIPIIAMTANAFAEDVQASLDAGMNGHLSKPIVMEEVVSTISRNLRAIPLS